MQDRIARIFVGFDSKEVVAYHVLAQSIIAHSSIPVLFSPIVLGHLDGLFVRERNPLQSTEFSFSRFMVPYLSSYDGWSLFMDCDMLARADIAELWELCDDRYAVMCVKHDYVPKSEQKFLGQVQTKYEKKNWSSVMLFNNARCRALHPILSTRPPDCSSTNSNGSTAMNTSVHCRSNGTIWSTNTTTGRMPKLVHFTDGGPYFDEYRNDEYADEWFATRERMLHVTQRETKS